MVDEAATHGQKTSSPSARDRRHLVFPLVTIGLGTIPLSFSLGIIPLVLFPEETIDLTVHPDNLEVRALYTYKNPWPFPIVQGFGLPFPVDTQHPDPAPVELSLANTGEPVPTRRLFGYDTFELRFAPNETIPVALYYKQQTPTHNARYILKTTHAWWRPLSRGTYLLHTAGIRSINSNYPMEGHGAEWHWERRNFMPDRDWQIEWSTSEK